MDTGYLGHVIFEFIHVFSKLHYTISNLIPIMNTDNTGKRVRLYEAECRRKKKHKSI